MNSGKQDALVSYFVPAHLFRQERDNIGIIFIMDARDLKVVKRFKELVMQRVRIHELRVFGSRARGDASADSDLDILVVVDQLDRTMERYISDCAWEAGFPEDIVVVPIPISLDALKNRPLRSSVFIKNVYHEGIAV